MRHNNKKLLIGGLCAAVLIMAVGYAAFNTVLRISGVANITSTWNVVIDQIMVQSEDGGKSIKADVLDNGQLSAVFETELTTPGDSVTYLVRVKDNGSLPAKLDSITFDQKNVGSVEEDDEALQDNLTEEQLASNPIVFEYSGVTPDETIVDPDGGFQEFTVTVKYNENVEKQPTDVQLKNKLTMTLGFVEHRN